MKPRDRMTRRLGWAGALGLALTAGMTLATQAQAQDPTVVQDGRQHYSYAGCGGCHGEQGQGGVSPDLPAGPSLRATMLEHESLVEVISCGLPGTEMPAWLQGAYTDTACYGLELGPPPARTMVIGLLTADQIEAMVTYITTEIKAD